MMINTQPQALDFKVEHIFPCPIYISQNPEYVQELNKASDPIIKKTIANWKKNNPKATTPPNSYHSENLWGYDAFKPLANVILQNSWNIIAQQGYNIQGRKPMLTEMWVQEFPKEGGFHDIHIHGNNQVSGFYFLKCSEKTSHPVFHEPKPGKQMTDLLTADKSKVNIANQSIHYKVKPGTFIFFNSYMPHSYVHQKGKDTFRFIHFNVQMGLDPAAVQNV